MVYGPGCPPSCGSVYPSLYAVTMRSLRSHYAVTTVTTRATVTTRSLRDHYAVTTRSLRFHSQQDPSTCVSFRGTSREPQGLWASYTAQRTEQARSTLFTLLFFSSPGLEPNPARLEASVHSSLDLKHFTAGEH